MNVTEISPATASFTPQTVTGAESRLWPRITLVTAVYNGERYLEDTIQSILQQCYPNLEYIVVDDGSTDGTVEIIKKYERHIAWWTSQRNTGLYGALNTGFARSTGDVLGWLNANDKLHTNGLFVVGSVFSAFPQVEWITGRPTVFSDDGMTVELQDLPRWSRPRFLAGANRHIQQESTFWKRSLWERAGGALSTEFRAEGDFELWVRFFRYAQLYSVDALIGGWRFHPNSLSHGNVNRYNQGCDTIVDRELSRTREYRSLAAFTRFSRTMKRIPKVRGIWQRLVANKLLWCLHRLPGSDWAPVIRYRGDKWQFERK
jgi:glycosyltransferase involved in cell wall biosynthesis